MLAQADITQMQQDRSDRARAGLAHGEFKFTTAETGWLVVWAADRSAVHPADVGPSRLR